MTLPEDIYSQRILELAAAIPRTARLEAPQASATAHSKLCGSTVTVDLAMEGDIVTDYGQSVKACLLGQSSASVMGREIIGSTAAELRAVGAAMRNMLTRLQGTPSLDPPGVRCGRRCHRPDRVAARRRCFAFDRACLRPLGKVRTAMSLLVQASRKRSSSGPSCSIAGRSRRCSA
jgi:NifU-like protein involved in Fe-S cluster formation